MKIRDIQQNGKVGPAGQNSATPAAQNQGAMEDEDKGDLSPQSREMNKTSQTPAAAPDARAEKVEGFKKQVESGQYKVNSNALAEKMLKKFLFDLKR